MTHRGQITSRFARLLWWCAAWLAPDAGGGSVPVAPPSDPLASLRLRYPGAPEAWLAALARHGATGDFAGVIAAAADAPDFKPASMDPIAFVATPAPAPAHTNAHALAAGDPPLMTRDPQTVAQRRPTRPKLPIFSASPMPGTSATVVAHPPAGTDNARPTHVPWAPVADQVGATSAPSLPPRPARPRFAKTAREPAPSGDSRPGTAQQPVNATSPAVKFAPPSPLPQNTPPNGPAAHKDAQWPGVMTQAQGPAYEPARNQPANIQWDRLQTSTLTKAAAQVARRHTPAPVSSGSAIPAAALSAPPPASAAQRLPFSPTTPHSATDMQDPLAPRRNTSAFARPAVSALSRWPDLPADATAVGLQPTLSQSSRWAAPHPDQEGRTWIA